MQPSIIVPEPLTGWPSRRTSFVVVVIASILAIGASYASYHATSGVAPIWLVLHYRAKGRIGAGLADGELPHPFSHRSDVHTHAGDGAVAVVVFDQNVGEHQDVRFAWLNAEIEFCFLAAGHEGFEPGIATVRVDLA